MNSRLETFFTQIQFAIETINICRMSQVSQYPFIIVSRVRFEEIYSISGLNKFCFWNVIDEISAEFLQIGEPSKYCEVFCHAL